MPLVRMFVAYCVLGFGPLVAALAMPPVLNGGYTIRTWQTEEGLPQNTVTAITQTRDGYMWIGTFGGLARFDGERFAVFDAVSTPNLVDSQITALFEDKDGVLWIGHYSGKITRYREGKFEPFARDGAARSKVVAISQDAAGRVWFLRQDSTLESADGGATLVISKDPSSVGTWGLVRSHDGTLWVVADGMAVRMNRGEKEPIEFGEAQTSGYVMGVGAAADGGLWVVRDGWVKKWVAGRWAENRGRCPWGEIPITGVIEMSDGNLAVGTLDDGVYLVAPDGRSRHFDHSNGLAQNWARSLYEDREGDLWLGAGTGGLAAMRPTAFAVLNSPDQWRGRAVLSVAPAADGALWVGTEGAGLYRYRHETWKNFGENEGIKNQFVWSVATGSGGNVWAGTWGGGVYRLQDDRFFPLGSAPLLDPVLALNFTEEDRTLWIGTGVGAVRWKDDGAHWLYRHREEFGTNVSAVARDRHGVMWLGTLEGGLIRFEDGNLTRFHKPEGLSSNSVQCLLADDDVLWIGTPDAGLNRLKNGRFSAIGVGEGLPSNVICHIEDDGQGYLWLSTHHGIVRVTKMELNRCADRQIPAVAARVYDRNDGLPTIEYSGGLQAAGCRTMDGRLWFTSSKGLVSVDPARVRLNPTPPPVVIESLAVDGRTVEAPTKSPSAISLAPDHQRLEFEFTALSFVAASKVLFKYRLAGLDKSWVSAGPKRVASYSHLPPGNYRFQVIACNNDGVWNTIGASFPFSVRPFYWQTWWFRGVVALSTLTLVGWGVRHETHRRIKRRLEQLERERAVEAERARIAQDIHDDVGASLTRITMLSQSVRDESGSPDSSVNAALDSICRTTQEVTRSLEEIVWAINPRHDTVDSLVSYMGKFAHDVVSAAGIRCRLDLPVELPPWTLTTQTRHNVLLAFKEVLHNSVRHAAATEIRVSLSLKTHGFEITVEDNGRGFDAASSTGASRRRMLGNGLANMHQRLADIDGRCEITSEPGRGTRVLLSVPIAEHLRLSGTSHRRANRLSIPKSAASNSTER